MTDLRIQRCTVPEIMEAPEFPDLVQEYTAESKVQGMPTPNARIATYAQWETTGMLFSWSATEDDKLVGFLSFVAPILPHFDRQTAVCESFFVAKSSRPTGAGLRLLAAAEEAARDIGSPGLFFSAPIGSRLEELLPKCGYRPVSHTFFKGFYDA
jgi:GNAT superfamily N-acetyltransferase